MKVFYVIPAFLVCSVDAFSSNNNSIEELFGFRSQRVSTKPVPKVETQVVATAVSGKVPVQESSMAYTFRSRSQQVTPKPVPKVETQVVATAVSGKVPVQESSMAHTFRSRSQQVTPKPVPRVETQVVATAVSVKTPVQESNVAHTFRSRSQQVTPKSVPKVETQVVATAVSGKAPVQESSMPYTFRSRSQQKMDDAVIANEDNDITIMKKITEAYSRIPMDADVHTMTTTFARPYYPYLKKLEQKYIGINNGKGIIPFEEINKEVTNLFATALSEEENLLRNFPADPMYLFNVEKIKLQITLIDKIMKNIKMYWGNPIDKETGHDLREVLSNVYRLSKTLKTEYDDEYMHMLLNSLAENIETKGGCHEGVTGRLVALYFWILQQQLKI